MDNYNHYPLIRVDAIVEVIDPKVSHWAGIRGKVTNVSYFHSKASDEQRALGYGNKSDTVDIRFPSIYHTDTIKTQRNYIKDYPLQRFENWQVKIITHPGLVMTVLQQLETDDKIIKQQAENPKEVSGAQDKFKVGDIVTFAPPVGHVNTGTIIECNPSFIRIETEDGHRLLTYDHASLLHSTPPTEDIPPVSNQNYEFGERVLVVTDCQLRPVNTQGIITAVYSPTVKDNNYRYVVSTVQFGNEFRWQYANLTDFNLQKIHKEDSMSIEHRRQAQQTNLNSVLGQIKSEQNAIVAQLRNLVKLEAESKEIATALGAEYTEVPALAQASKELADQKATFMAQSIALEQESDAVQDLLDFYSKEQ